MRTLSSGVTVAPGWAAHNPTAGPAANQRRVAYAVNSDARFINSLYLSRTSLVKYRGDVMALEIYESRKVTHCDS